MTEDHLDKETSVSAEITPTGVKASARVRTIAAIDRLLGNFVDRWNAPMEAETAEIRAKADAKVKMIDAVADLGIRRLEADPKWANQALSNHLEAIWRRQDNKSAVVDAALEDLRNEPPTDEQAVSGGDTLDESFISRFERYAEDATNEQLREKWGKVLAAEIKSPKSISSKVMRVVDELDPATALIFERICEHRMGRLIAKCLIDNMDFTEQLALVEAGLLVEPGLTGQVRIFQSVSDNGGVELWIGDFGIGSVALPKDMEIPQGEGRREPIASTEPPGAPVLVLTEVGLSVSSILPDRQEAAFAAYIDRLASFLAPAPIREYRQGDAGQLSHVRTVQVSHTS